LNSAGGKADERITCPKCGSDAYYKYGKTQAGKARYLCLSCNRQFVACPVRKVNEKRPPCPVCGKPMHVYMRAEDHIRFRCKDYPEVQDVSESLTGGAYAHELLRTQRSRKIACEDAYA
jgi:ssDNA-binding Zn-finger/Zn-ribbon topoisomerase 1